MSVYPASTTSKQPSLSESNSKASIVWSPSESKFVFNSALSSAPSLSASTKPVSLKSTLPLLFVSKASFPDSTISKIPSLSESKSIPFGIPSESISGIQGSVADIKIPSNWIETLVFTA